MPDLKIGLKVDGEEAYRLIEVASEIIQNHKEDLTEQEKAKYQNAVNRFAENGIQVKA